MGPCAGGAVYSPAITDFVLMTEGTSYMFITGPDVVKTVTGEEVSFEELGGAVAHATKSGVAHLVAPDEQAVIDDARYLLTFLPQNNLETAPWAAPSGSRRPRVAGARRAHPRLAEQAVRHEARDRDGRRRRRVPRDPARPRREHRLRVRAARRSRRRRRREPAARAGRRPRHRRVRQGGALRPDVRRLQRPARHVRRRPRVPPGNRTRSGAGSSGTGRSSSTRTPRRRCRSSR